MLNKTVNDKQRFSAPQTPIHNTDEAEYPRATDGDHKFEKASVEDIDNVILTYGHDINGELRIPYSPEDEPCMKDDFPDGGLRAWIVVFGAACCTFSTFGFLNCWGIFQAYYQETLLADYSPSAIAWIGSLQYSLVFFPGLIVGRLFDIGYFRAIFVPASILLVAATVLVGQCTKYWHFVICQGIAIGIACGTIFGCTNAIIPHWFSKKRSRALGYTALGSAVSGTAVPIATKHLIPAVGFPWTMRILGAILFVTVGMCNIAIKRRLPPVNVKGGLFNFAIYKNVPFSLYSVSGLILLLGLYTFPSYISTSATRLKDSPGFGFYFVALLNAGSFFGRLSAGFLGDVAGPLNVIIPHIFLIGVVTFTWPFMQSKTSLAVITVIYGFSVGSYVTLSLNPIMNMGGEGDVGRRVGMFLTVMAFGTLAGPPISGIIIARTGGFEAVGLYAGSAIFLGGFLMLIVRYLLLRSWMGKT